MRPSKFSPAASKNCVTVILVRLSCPPRTSVSGEPQPCWSLGLYLRRGGRTLADVLPVGPLSEACACEMQDMIASWQTLAVQLNRNGRVATGFQVDAEMGLRILFTANTRTISIDPAADPRLLRAPVQPQAIPRIRSAKILALSCPQRSENSIFMPYNELR